MLHDLILENRQTLGLFEVRNYLPLFWCRVNRVQSPKLRDNEKQWVQTPHDLLKQWISQSWWLSKITYIVKSMWSVQLTLLCSTICFYIGVTPLIDVGVFVGGMILRCCEGSVSSNDSFGCWQSALGWDEIVFMLCLVPHCNGYVVVLQVDKCKGALYLAHLNLIWCAHAIKSFSERVLMSRTISGPAHRWAEQIPISANRILYDLLYVLI